MRWVIDLNTGYKGDLQYICKTLWMVSPCEAAVQCWTERQSATRAVLCRHSATVRQAVLPSMYERLGRVEFQQCAAFLLELSLLPAAAGTHGHTNPLTDLQHGQTVSGGEAGCSLQTKSWSTAAHSSTSLSRNLCQAQSGSSSVNHPEQPQQLVNSRGDKRLVILQHCHLGQSLWVSMREWQQMGLGRAWYELLCRPRAGLTHIAQRKNEIK